MSKTSTTIEPVRRGGVVNRRNLVTLLRSQGACTQSLDWAEGRTVSRESWEACERGDWLLWIAARLKLARKRVVYAACQCARQALVHVPAGEERPLAAIETAESWALDRGATLEDVRRAYAAAANAAAYADAAAAYAADAYAAYAAAANAAAYAAAAYAAAYAAANAAAYAADARQESLRQSADIVRRIIPWEIIKRYVPAV